MVGLDKLERSGKLIDVLCFTEHNMINSDLKLLNIPNFMIASCYARSNRKGGACILVRNDHQFKEIKSVTKYFITNVIEGCAIELTEHNVVILCIYRVPKNKNKNRAQYYDIFLNNLNDILNLFIYNTKKKSLFAEISTLTF